MPEEIKCPQNKTHQNCPQCRYSKEGLCDYPNEITKLSKKELDEMTGRAVRDVKSGLTRISKILTTPNETKLTLPEIDEARIISDEQQRYIEAFPPDEAKRVRDRILIENGAEMMYRRIRGDNG